MKKKEASTKKYKFACPLVPNNKNDNQNNNTHIHTHPYSQSLGKSLGG